MARLFIYCTFMIGQLKHNILDKAVFINQCVAIGREGGWREERAVYSKMGKHLHSLGEKEGEIFYADLARHLS